MNTWNFGDHSFAVDTHGNMRQYRDLASGRIFLVRVELFYNFECNEQCVEVYVDGDRISSRRWELYRSGKMYAHQLPFGWGLSTGFDTGWRFIKRIVKAEVSA